MKNIPIILLLFSVAIVDHITVANRVEVKINAKNPSAVEHFFREVKDKNNIAHRTGKNFEDGGKLSHQRKSEIKQMKKKPEKSTFEKQLRNNKKIPERCRIQDIKFGKAKTEIVGEIKEWNIFFTINFYTGFRTTNASSTQTASTTTSSTKITVTNAGPTSTPSQSTTPQSTVKTSIQQSATALPITNGIQSSVSTNCVSSTTSPLVLTSPTKNIPTSSPAPSQALSSSSLFTTSSNGPTTTTSTSSANQTAVITTTLPTSTSSSTAGQTTTTITTLPTTTTVDPRVKTISVVDGSITFMFCNAPNVTKIVSAFYGNSTVCGPYDITANLSFASGANVVIFSVWTTNFWNLCPNSRNTLNLNYYCDTNMTMPSNYRSSVYQPGTLSVTPMCTTGNITMVSSQYVQPTCTITPIPELVTECNGKPRCTVPLNVTSATGTDDPLGCRAAFISIGMYVKFGFICA